MCQEINAVKTQNGEISDPTELAECFNESRYCQNY